MSLLIPSYGSRARHQNRGVVAWASENGVPIVEANVGVTMIISKGEVVACGRRVNAVTVATIESTAAPSTANRTRQDEAFSMLARYGDG